MSDSLLQNLLEGTLAAIEPLVESVDDPGLLANVLDALGANDPRLVNGNLTSGLRALGQGVQDVRTILAAPDLSLSSVQAALDGVRSLVAAIQALSAANGPAYPDLGADLVNLAFTNTLREGSPLLFQLAVALGFVQRGVLPPLSVNGEVVRPTSPVDRLKLDKAGKLLSDPAALIRPDLPTPALSTAANAQKTADAIVDRWGGVLTALGIPWNYGFKPGDERFLGEAVATASNTLTMYEPFHLANGANAGLCISLSPADADDLGVVLTPFGAVNLQGTAGGWSIDVQLSAGIGAMAFGGGKGTQILADVATTDVHASVKAALASDGAAPGAPAFVLGSDTGSRLELGQPQISAQLNTTAAGAEIEVALDTGASALVVAAGDGDGFLAEILPAGGLRATFNLGLAWGSKKGLTFRGSAGLDATIQVGLTLGPLTLSTIHLGLAAQADGSVVNEISADAGLTLGPVKAVVQRVGLTSTLSFPAAGGSIGVADLAVGFKPPTGLGISIDASGVVTGGGFLQFDPARQQYAGVVQLSLHDRLTLTGVGLLSTRLPDGRPGYSLLIFITADGFQPIPLGFGFQLVGIGGLVGINRTFDQAVLTAGMKTDTLGQILFPRDPVGNAPALLAALGGAFPIERGSYLLGLLAKITWFTPTLVELDLALTLKLGGATELLMLGRVSALLPTRDNDLLRLTMDTIGVLNFDAGTLAAEAMLVDSRLVHQFAITGAAAVQARWGSGGQSGNATNFILAVGGLNPRYTPPPGFPALERVAIALCSGDNPRLLCEGYFALTANTIQFGARASLYAEAAGFRVTGDIGFDVLVQALPFQFVADFHASVQLKWKSYNLAKVALAGSLSGPVPLRLLAKATIEILWFSVSMHLDLSLNPTAALQSGSAPPVALDGLVAAALGTASNWRTATGPAHGVVLRRVSTSLALDPLGQLIVEQSVAPLNTTRPVTTYGGAPLTGASRFAVTGSVNGAAGTATPGAFAPARYFTLSDDEKLAAPSFETFDAGVVLGPGSVTNGPGVSAPLVYRALTLDAVQAGNAGAPATLTPAPAPYAMPSASLTAQRTGGAAAMGPSRLVGRQRFGNPAAPPAALVGSPEWRLMRAADGTLAPTGPAPTNWSETRAALATLNRAGAAWQMVAKHELA
ncbi:MAG TPA: DUF6603 domain-containing protein [Candidatus Limnocylindria bacterium]|nr:DUF6603 domain-containing protein [Candidatus Limnocylindria bacterium]